MTRTLGIKGVCVCERERGIKRGRERERNPFENHTFGENPLRHFPRFIVANVKGILPLNEQPFVEKTQCWSFPIFQSATNETLTRVF